MFWPMGDNTVLFCHLCRFISKSRFILSQSRTYCIYVTRAGVLFHIVFIWITCNLIHKHKYIHIDSSMVH